MRRTDLMHEANISSNILAQLRREEPISLENIGKRYTVLGCSVDDMLERIKKGLDDNHA